MRATWRHQGIVVKDLAKGIEEYKHLGFRIRKRTFETISGRKLKIVKMRDGDKNEIELIEGDWEPHLAVTVDSRGHSLDEIWTKFIKKAGDTVAYWKNGGLRVFCFRDSSGNMIEVVLEKSRRS